MKSRTTRVEVGLTGGIACGKSEVARVWMAQGVPVLDADEVAHEVMMPGTSTYRAVVDAFGPGIVGPDQRLDRSRLGALVFASEALRQQLDRLVHPAVREVWRAWREDRRSAGDHAVVAIPLLFEVGADSEWDAIVCVVATHETMVQRLKGRGLNRAEAERRIAAQMPVQEKAKRSDVVIENNGNMNDLERAAMNAWLAIRAQGSYRSGAEFT